MSDWLGGFAARNSKMPYSLVVVAGRPGPASSDGPEGIIPPWVARWANKLPNAFPDNAARIVYLTREAYEGQVPAVEVVPPFGQPTIWDSLAIWFGGSDADDFEKYLNRP
jgi:hypothetical protein